MVTLRDRGVSARIVRLQVRGRCSFALDEVLETMTLKLDYYAETKTVTAAIDVTVGPGL